MPERINPPLPTRTLEHAQCLRNASTDAENKLWQRLRSGQLNSLKFRRQHSIPPYIMDFVCLKARIIIELDGCQHDDEQDAARTRFLEAKGFKVIRFWDNEVLQQPDAVLEAILNSVGDRTLTPTPLPEGEGLQEQST